MLQELENLSKMTSYITPSRYISGRIVEYDIKSANISILLKNNAISKDYFNYLSMLPKQDREVEIGLLIRTDMKYGDIIKNGIIEAKKNLFLFNNINPLSIIRIANDAVYINSSIDLMYTKFDNIEFKQKNIYNSMIKLDKLLIFFSYSNGEINIDIKGIKASIQKLHENFFLTFLGNVLYLIEKVSAVEALNFINDFFDKYINLNLPIEYYRELNSTSYYKYKYSGYYLSKIDNINEVDINYNLFILRELWSIVLEKCNLKR